MNDKALRMLWWHSSKERLRRMAYVIYCGAAPETRHNEWLEGLEDDIRRGI